MTSQRRRFKVVAAKVVLALLLLGAMLTAFTGLLVVGIWTAINGPMWLGVICLVTAAVWSYFASARRQKDNPDHFKDYGV